MKKTLEQRFWEKVDVREVDECWEWTANKIPQGYGYISVGNKHKGTRKEIRAHRVSYEIAKGKLKDGQVVMHTCDNPSCVNPNHLVAGTQSENLKDMVRKGRNKKVVPHGEMNKTRRLGELAVQTIRIIDGYLPDKYFAELFGVSKSTVCHARSGYNWSWLKSTKQALS